MWRENPVANRPGSFEALLTRSFSGRQNPYRWLARAVSASAQLVLDIACGAGAVSRELHRPSRMVIGLDLSAEEIALASERSMGPWVQADGRQLPFPDQTFDAVTTSMGLAVIQPTVDLLSEVSRVLKPGGLFVALLPSMFTRDAGDLALAAQLSWQLRSPLRLPGSLRPSPAGVWSAVGLTKVEDAREHYGYRIASSQDAMRLLDALELSEVPTARVEQALRFLTERVSDDGEIEFGIPLRRIVAVR